ncbi:aromatic ring-hydroxylating dioxygenase subunit alpha [Comamonas testosteroni]|uniref:Aromatic ring-hydroxylating dioxygenase subunit alpha n=1 Tax=Comamonas testosteroni TaxID=285 RepID=A0A373FR19_COMTE|nr:aromatic ring-hydroxylating dioxygenase subunit alpha [Comamonas testosteroni]RGE45982.1 aromatic ring-hydroxylating dioxygenase subunit alpha [Comamonas testosteroni]
MNTTKQAIYARNTWYVAASSAEVTDKPLGRQICGERIVFYRALEDKIAAVEDFCPHRGAPLSLGRVCEGKLVCGYHGLEMGCDGKTIAMPGQRVRGFPAIKSYPVEERYGFIWVWPGDKEAADAALIPNLPWHDNPEWAYDGGLFHIKADYRLMIDNLMDLTHETYVHSTSIGQTEIDETPCKTEVLEGNEVVTSRFMENVEAPPFWKMALRSNGLADDVPVDRWQICRFTPPSHVLIEVGVAHAGKGGYEAADEHKVYSMVVDFITPEADGSMWYFWGMARKFNPSDASVTEAIKQGQHKIFSEDLEMLELQQRNLVDYPERQLLKLNIDAGGVQSRRIIERLIALEQSQSTSVTETATA